MRRRARRRAHLRALRALRARATRRAIPALEPARHRPRPAPRIISCAGGRAPPRFRALRARPLRRILRQPEPFQEPRAGDRVGAWLGGARLRERAGGRRVEDRESLRLGIRGPRAMAREASWQEALEGPAASARPGSVARGRDLRGTPLARDRLARKRL